MKINFKKITAIGVSILMTGMTAGIAAAANFPSPFVQSNVADVAIVYGTGTGVSSLDLVQAGQIQTTLGESMPKTGTGNVTGGDSVLLERSSDKLNLGDDASTVFVTSIDSDNLPSLLADGTYTDDVNTEYDFTQKITLGANLDVSHFSDSDYKDKVPTIGIKLNDDAHVINYTLDFTTNPAYNATTMETTTLKLMGKSYYVLDVVGVGDSTTNQNKTTLLDSANAAVITEGESATVGGKVVTIEYIGSTEVKLTVDGETTNSLAEGGTYKLADGTYIGIKDIMYVSKDTGISKVEISIGTGKLEITHGTNIELNDVTVQEIIGFMVQDSSYKLDKIVLQWTTDDEEFIATDSEILMPGFKAVKISMSDFVFPTEEVTTVENSGSDVINVKTTLKDGAVTIPLLQANSTGQFTILGKSSTDRLVTGTDTHLFFNESAGDKYFIASWNSTTEAQSYYLKASLTEEDSIDYVTFTNEITKTEVTKKANGSSVSFGDVTLTLTNVTKDGSNKKFFNITGSSGVTFNTLYTKDGLKMYLPYLTSTSSASEGGIEINTTTGWSAALGPYTNWSNYYGNLTFGPSAGHGWNSFYLWFAGEDKDGNLAAGKDFNVTVSESGTSDKVHVSAVDTAGTGPFEIGETDNFEEYSISDLATKTLYKTSGDQDTVEITYHGDQAYAKVYVTAPETSVGGTSSLGNILVKDSEVSSVSGKNLIVVGGSCINSAAANMLGGALCGAGFTTKTKVGTGQFLIQSMASPYNSAKVALLVSGYEVADTVNGATYLRTKTVDTTAGKKYVGTSATNAELVVA